MPSTPRPLPRVARRAASSLLVCAACVVGACRAPGPPPDAAPPAAELLGTAVSVAARPAPLPLDESGAPAERIDVAVAIRAALAASADVQAALARTRGALAACDAERRLPNPVAALSLRFAESGARPGLDVGIAEDLVALLTRGARADAADARLRAAVADALATALDVAADAARGVVAVASAERRAALLDARAALSARVAAAAHERARSGEGGPLDATLCEEEEALARGEAAAAWADVRAARLALARRLGRPRDPALWRVDATDVAAGVGADARDEDAWINAALARRPELRDLDWQLAAHASDARRAPWDVFDGAEGGVDVEGTASWEAGPSLTLPVPLWDDGSARSAARTAAVDELHHRRTALARRIVEDVRTAWHAVHAADAALRAAETQRVPLAERRRREAQAVYDAGESDVTALLLAERAHTDALLAAADARAAAARARIDLHRAAAGVPGGVAGDGVDDAADDDDTDRAGPAQEASR